ASPVNRAEDSAPLDSSAARSSPVSAAPPVYGTPHCPGPPPGPSRPPAAARRGSRARPPGSAAQPLAPRTSPAARTGAGDSVDWRKWPHVEFTGENGQIKSVGRVSRPNGPGLGRIVRVSALRSPWSASRGLSASGPNPDEPEASATDG